ncbi:MAG: peptidoglycan DD-metalloendopeptidase family protein [Myxococcota bacterium]|nr:peptidoglycan DD-metalloendopeptidase family protein [Myxococcota bacterium]
MSVLLFAVAVLLRPGLLAAQSPEELDALRERIDESREKVERHEAAERATYDRVDELEQSLASIAGRVRAAREDTRRARAALEEIQRETKRLASRLATTRDAMRKRAVALYKAGEVGPLRVLFASGSLRDLLQRMAALQGMLEYDASLVLRYQTDFDAYEAARSDAERATQRHETAFQTLGAEEASLRKERGGKQRLLARIRNDRKAEREVLVELEKAALALAATLTELGEGGRKHADWVDASGFSAIRGRLPLPVNAAIKANFGRVVDEEFLTQTVRNGVEFGAEEGEPVVATSRGEVRFAGWFRGYGRMVILEHGEEYFTISGHLSEIDVGVGDRVERGESIGRVGDTGSLTGAKLYFELRRGSQALDPAGWFSPDELAQAR